MKFKKSLSTLLAAATLWLPLSAKLNAQTNEEVMQALKNKTAITETVSSKKYDLNAQTSSEYETYLENAIKYSQKTEDRNLAIENFKQAIRLDQKKTLERMILIEKEQPELYKEIKPEYLAAILQNNKEKQESKKEKSWFGKIPTAVKIIGGLAALAGIEYAIGDPLNIFTKKENPEEEDKNYNTDLKFKIINATKGILIDEYIKPQVMTGTDVTISIDELKSMYGITGIDNERIIIRGPLENCEFVDFEKDGDSTFTVDKDKYAANNFQFTIFLLPEQTSKKEYEALDGFVDQGYGKLYFTPNWTYHRQDEDGATGPQEPIDHAVAIINAAIANNWMPGGGYGKLTKVESGGDMYCGYYYGPTSEYGMSTRGPPSKAMINATTATTDLIRKRIQSSEITELSGGFDDINDNPSHLFLFNPDSDQFNLSATQLWNYLLTKDRQKIGITTTTNNALSTVMDLVSITQKIGDNAEIGINKEGINAGFENEKINLKTRFRKGSEGIENHTTAQFTGEKFQGYVGIALLPNKQLYNVQATFQIEKVNFKMKGNYDTKEEHGMAAISIGAPIRNGQISAGIIASPQMFGFSAEATKALKEMGVVGFSLAQNKEYTTGNKSTSITASAQFNKVPLIGQISTTVNYTKAEPYYNGTSWTVSKPIGPININFSMISAKDQPMYYRIAISGNIPIGKK